MITEDYVSFEIAKLLKEKGFDEELETLIRPDGSIYFLDESSGFSSVRHIKIKNSDINPYSDSISRPTLQMAVKWLRKTYKLEVRSTYDLDKDSWWGNINPMFEETDKNLDIYQKALGFDYQGKSCEEAAGAAIKYCLENLI